MGYHIVYQSAQKRAGGRRAWFRLPVMILLCLTLFFCLVGHYWPEGAEFIQRTVLSSRDSLPVAALNDVAEALGSGESVVSSLLRVYRTITA